MPLTSTKFKESEASLPDELRAIYRRLVEEYEYLTTVHYGRGYVAYKVLADLVLAGWRPSADPATKSRI
jgi:hypothetical protein